MSKAFNRRSIEHNLLDLLIVPDMQPTGCSDHGPLQSVVYMGGEVPELFAVRQVSCAYGCKHTTRRLTNEERIEVNTKLVIAANLVRSLQTMLGMDTYTTGRVKKNGFNDIRQPAGPSTRPNIEIDVTDTSDADTDTDKAPTVVSSKRKATGTLQPVFKRQALPLLPHARGSETNLMLASGKEVRGFDYSKSNM